jgi:hypothetical protein
VETSVTTLAVSPSVARMTSDRRSVFLDLHTRLKEFSSHTSSVLAGTTHETVLAESRTRVIHHETLGPVLEMASSTLVQCELDAGWAYFMGTKKTLPAMNRRDFAYHAEARCYHRSSDSSLYSYCLL